MTVKEVFDLRRQGKIEEAYEAIRPMYAVHRGKYTTLCMFWTARDILMKRLYEQRLDEAEKIFGALMRVLPNVEDDDGRARSAMLQGALKLSQESQTFRMLDFVEHGGMSLLGPADWQPFTMQDGRELPSTAQRMLERCFYELLLRPSVEQALKVMPLLEESVKRFPGSKDNEGYLDIVRRIMEAGEKELAGKSCAQ